MGVIRRIIEVGGAEVVRASDEHGCIPLHEACFKGNLEVVTLLCDEGGDDSVRHVSKWGTTPLHSACFGNCPVKVVKLLIDRGGPAALKQTNNLGNSPLHLSCDGNASIEVVELLIDRGGVASLEFVNVNGENALHYACLHNASVEVFELLVSKAWIDTEPVENIPGITVTVILEWIQMQNESARSKIGGDDTEGRALFQSPFIQKILNDMFIHPQYLTVLMIDFYIQLMFVGIFSFGINDAVRNGNEIPAWITFLLVVGILWSAGRELLQMATTPLKVYLHDGTEFLDWLQIGLSCISLRYLLYAHEIQDNSYHGGVLTVTTGLTWLLFIYVLGDLIPEIAIFVAALRRIIVKLVPFLVTTLLLVFGFAHMFYIANISHGNCAEGAEILEDEEITEDNWTCDLSANYFMALSMLLEGAHYFLVENPIRLTEPTSNAIISICFAFLIITILLNILIAIISDVFSEVREKGTEEFWSNRYASMFELHRIYIGMGTCMNKTKGSREGRGTIIVPPMLAATPTKPTLTTTEEKAGESDEEEEGEEGEDEFKDAKDEHVPSVNADNSTSDSFVEETISKPSPTPKVITSSPLPDRFDFASTLIKDTYFKHYHTFPEEERHFIEWWTGISTKPISFRNRIGYFISRSLLGDLIIPGKVFEKILRGMQRDQCLMHYLARIATYFIFVVVPLALFCLFVVGLLTLGLCWPKWLREFLFFGSIGMVSSAGDNLAKVQGNVTELMGEIAELKAVMYESKKLLLEQNDAARSRRE